MLKLCCTNMDYDTYTVRHSAHVTPKRIHVEPRKDKNNLKTEK